MSELGNMGCENLQYVQTESMSPTLHVPRCFLSHKSSYTHTRRHFSHNSFRQCAFLSGFHKSGINKSHAQALCSTAVHSFTGSRRHSWKGQDAKWEVCNNFKQVRLYKDDSGVMRKPLPSRTHIYEMCHAPQGAKWGHYTHTHTSLSHYLSLLLFLPSHTHTHIH